MPVAKVSAAVAAVTLAACVNSPFSSPACAVERALVKLVRQRALHGLGERRFQRRHDGQILDSDLETARDADGSLIDQRDRRSRRRSRAVLRQRVGRGRCGDFRVSVLGRMGLTAS